MNGQRNLLLFILLSFAPVAADAWTVLTSDNSALPTNDIRALIRYDSNTVFFGPYTHALFRLNLSDTTIEKLSSQRFTVHDFDIDDSGSVYAATSSGCYRYRDGAAISRLFGGSLSSIAVVDSFVYYSRTGVKCSCPGFYRYSLHDKDSEELEAEDGPLPCNITTMEKLQDGSLLLAVRDLNCRTMQNRLINIDGRLLHYPGFDDFHAPGQSSPAWWGKTVVAMKSIGDSTWLAADDGQLLIKAEQNHWIGGEPQTAFRSIDGLRSGNIWLASDQGLIQYNKGVWNRYRTNSSPIPSNTVRDAAVVRSDCIVAATDSGLVLFTPGHATAFRDRVDRYSRAPDVSVSYSGQFIRIHCAYQSAGAVKIRLYRHDGKLMHCCALTAPGAGVYRIPTDEISRAAGMFILTIARQTGGRQYERIIIR